MCLGKINLEETKRLQNENRVLTLYKVVYQSDYHILKAPFQYIPYNIGINESDRINRKLTKYEHSIVEKGFHLFCSSRAAKTYTNNRRTVIKVKCHTKHLVAVGKFLRFKSMVFTKFTIPKEEWDNAVK